MKTIKVDSLVIGAGLAGLTYAMEMADAGKSVYVLASSEDKTTSNSYLAQGGVVYNEGHDPELLIKDIEVATCGAHNPEALETIAKFGGSAVEEILLTKAEVPFDRDTDGSLKKVKEAAHSEARIIYSKDATGVAIMDSIYKKIEGLTNITVCHNSMAIDLMTLSHNSKSYADRYKSLTCIGAYVFDLEQNQVYAVLAQNVIIATGGVGQIFLHTTNGKEAFGHGLAMAKRVGARLMDLEYLQFHPTVFVKPGFNPLLISEALRGEGGVLINARGERFMDKIHPLGSLAPRDIVARAIAFELIDSSGNSVYLDMTAHDSEFIQNRFPNIYRECLKRGVDISSDPIPVVPAAHYHCGGIHTDMEGRTNIKGLCAIGECACTGLHGANRLASTSLLECVTMGVLTAKANLLEFREDYYLPEVKLWKGETQQEDTALMEQDLDLIRKTMWNYAGLIRTTKRIKRAERLISEINFEVKQFYSNSALTRTLLNLRSAVEVAQLIIYAASKNRKSLGCHYID
ncbi:MAG: FAD-binding protein [Bacteriovoracaceae bacterium]|jgi:L-aspartate oxidase|nr:FAD-binding protein [Bacteriovoracaceae bacterium]